MAISKLSENCFSTSFQVSPKRETRVDLVKKQNTKRNKIFKMTKLLTADFRHSLKPNSLKNFTEAFYKMLWTVNKPKKGIIRSQNRRNQTKHASEWRWLNGWPIYGTFQQIELLMTCVKKLLQLFHKITAGSEAFSNSSRFKVHEVQSSLPGSPWK